MKFFKKALSLVMAIAVLATVFVAPVSAVEQTAQTVEFSGTAKEFAYTYEGEGELTIEYDGSVEKPIVPGEYDVVIKVDGEPVDATERTLTITKAQLSVTGASANNRPYNGETTVTISAGTLNKEIPDVSLVSPATGTIADANAGSNKVVTAVFSLTGTNAEYCELTQPSLTVNITKAQLNVTGAAATNRGYNGTNVVAITGATLSPAPAGVTLANATTGTVENANVGTGKTVTTAFTLTGDNAANYEVIQPEGITVDITKAQVKIVPADQIYYGSTMPALDYVAKDEDNNEITIADIEDATVKEPGTAKDTPYLAMFDTSKFNASNYEITSIDPAYFVRLSADTTKKEEAAEDKIDAYKKIEGEIDVKAGSGDVTVYLCSNEYVIAMSQGTSFEFDNIKPGAYQLIYGNDDYTNVEDIVMAKKDLDLDFDLDDYSVEIKYDDSDSSLFFDKDFPRVVFGDVKGILPSGSDEIEIEVREADEKIKVPSSEDDVLQFEVEFSFPDEDSDYLEDNKYKLEEYVKVLVPYTGTFSSSSVSVYKNVKGTTAKTEISYSSKTISDADDATKECFNLDTKSKVITIFLKTVASDDADYVTLCIAESEDDDDDDSSSGGGGGGGSSSDGDYKLTVKQSTGGKITPSSTYVDYGDTQKFTITPNSGYEISDVLVDGDSVGAVSTYTFRNVKDDHDIKATFKKTGTTTNTNTTPGTTGSTGKFKDVNTGHWFYNAVNYVTSKNIMNGMSSTEFGPNTTITRGMFVTVLYRIEGEPNEGSNKFSDVARGAYYEKAVAWANANGIVSGMTATTFEPNRNITREQMATMLYRYAEYKEYDMSMDTNINLKIYDDYNSISSYATSALKWAAGTGLITGTSKTKMDPKMNSTRAMAAEVFMRFVQKY